MKFGAFAGKKQDEFLKNVIFDNIKNIGLQTAIFQSPISSNTLCINSL